MPLKQQASVDSLGVKSTPVHIAMIRFEPRLYRLQPLTQIRQGFQPDCELSEGQYYDSKTRRSYTAISRFQKYTSIKSLCKTLCLASSETHHAPLPFFRNFMSAGALS